VWALTAWRNSHTKASTVPLPAAPCSVPAPCRNAPGSRAVILSGQQLWANLLLFASQKKTCARLLWDSSLQMHHTCQKGPMPQWDTPIAHCVNKPTRPAPLKERPPPTPFSIFLQLPRGPIPACSCTLHRWCHTSVDLGASGFFGSHCLQLFGVGI
jgi:hypothetical protein